MRLRASSFVHKIPVGPVERPLVCGIAFGALVHVFMTFIVIPLSAIGSRPFVLQSFLAFLAVSMVVVGPSISLTVRQQSPVERVRHAAHGLRT